MKKTFMLLLLVSVMVFLLVAGASAADKKLKFAWCPTIDDPFYWMIGKGIEDKCKELGIDLFVSEYLKSWGAEIQVPVLEATAARGDIDLLITGPAAKDSLITPLKKIFDSGIEVITVDTYLGTGDYSKPSDFSFPLAFIGTNNFQGGVEVAHRLADMIGKKGKVFIETTNPDVSSVVERVEGFKKGIAEYPGITVVGVEYNLDVQEKAQQQVAAALQSNPDIVGVFGTNLYSARGAYQAVINAGLTGAVKIASWDATPDLIKALKDGQVDLVLAQNPYAMGQLATEWGYKFFTEKANVPKKLNPEFFFFTKENASLPESQKYIYQK
ncbi:MAG: ABC transporter substrate-binding protein [Candidatus Atribacteria bacterium]|nr:ABC transporter substrate-binding protein [Candidatus Atribacteria bacterium]